MNEYAPIGIFDSGFGGLTVLKEIAAILPQYDYLYLGDNARAPYGSRSFETVHHYTLEGVKALFERNCHLVILACNTASAKALRTIQQKNLPHLAPQKRVLGVIRPTAELIGQYSQSNHIGILGTSGTVNSESYLVEIEKFFPNAVVTQEACPLWVPLIENNEHLSKGADYFIEKHVQQLMTKDPAIDTIILACTHYPIIATRIKHFLPPHVQLIAQGPIVSASLVDYLKRHPELETKCSQQGSRMFLTTDLADTFNKSGTLFFGEPIQAQTVVIDHL